MKPWFGTKTPSDSSKDDATTPIPTKAAREAKTVDEAGERGDKLAAKSLKANGRDPDSYEGKSDRHVARVRSEQEFIEEEDRRPWWRR